MKAPGEKTPGRAAWIPAAACLLILLHMVLLGLLARRVPYTVDEPAYLLAGRALVQGSRWSTLQERLQGPLPLLASQAFAGRIDPADLDALRLRARLGLLPFSLLLLLVLWAWAREAWGRKGALLSLFLASISPMLLGYGPLIGADLAWTAFTCLTLWLFWRWLKRPSLFRLLAWGAALGLALATKYLAFVHALFLPLPALAVLVRGGDLSPLGGGNRRRRAPSRWGLAALSLVLAGGAALFFLHAAYLFQAPLFGTGRTGDLQSGLFKALSSIPGIRNLLGLLPEPLVLGADYQKAAAARFHGAFLGYLAPHPVFFLYYPLSLLLKVPVATWAFLVLALAAAGRRASRGGPALWLVLEGPGLFLLAAVTLTGKLKIGIRYVLPLLPLVMIRAGGWAGSLSRGPTLRRVMTPLLLAWAAFSSLAVYPHFLGYFNELAGGPGGGWRFFADSNCDWGQDREEGLAALKARHPGLAALGPWDGPRFGLLAGYAPWLQPPDPERPGRTYHWVRRFEPVDHYAAAWLVFRVRPGDFRRAARAGDGRAWGDLCLAWIARGDLEEARRALDSAPAGPSRERLGALLAALGRIRRGKARKVDWSLAARELAARGEMERALKLMEKAPPGERESLLVLLLLQGKSVARAKAILENEMRKGPLEAEKALMVSCGLYWSGDPEGAARVLRSARPPGPGSPLEKTWEAFRRMLRKALENERALKNPRKR